MGCGVLTNEEIHLLEDQELGQQLIALGRHKAELAAYEAKLTRAFDLAGAFRHDGSRNTVMWLVRNCRMSRPAAAAQVRLARRLATMPATRTALENGELTVDHAIALGKLAHSNRRPVRDAFPEAEETLVDQAKNLLYREFETMAAYWEDLVDPDGTETQAADDYDARHLHASETIRGLVRIDGTLDPVGGAIFLGELTRLERRLFEEDWAKAKTEHGKNTKIDHLWRTPAQRRADALQEMATRSANSEEVRDADGKRVPLFSVYIGPDIPKRLCELASGKVIAPGLLVPHLGDAEIERIVFGPEKRVLELSKTARFFRGALLRAMQLRDRRCSTPGCDLPAQYCQGDHIHPHSQGGQTTLDNGRMACGYNNRWAFQNQQRPVDNDPDPPDTS